MFPLLHFFSTVTIIIIAAAWCHFIFLSLFLFFALLFLPSLTSDLMLYCFSSLFSFFFWLCSDLLLLLFASFKCYSYSSCSSKNNNDVYRYWILPMAKVAPATQEFLSRKQARGATAATPSAAAPTNIDVGENSIASRITKTENKTIYHWMQTEIPSTWTDLMVLRFYFIFFSSVSVYV